MDLQTCSPLCLEHRYEKTSTCKRQTLCAVGILPLLTSDGRREIDQVCISHEAISSFPWALLTRYWLIQSRRLGRSQVILAEKMKDGVVIRLYRMMTYIWTIENFSILTIRQVEVQALRIIYYIQQIVLAKALWQSETPLELRDLPSRRKTQIYSLPLRQHRTRRIPTASHTSSEI